MAAKKLRTEKPGLHYLWHLVAIGLIKENGGAADPLEKWLGLIPPDDGPVSPEEGVTIAIIDNGCAGWRGNECDPYNPSEHPNLDGRRIVHPIDFTGHVEGAVYKGRSDDWSPEAANVDLLNGLGAIPGTLSGIRPQVADHIAGVLKHATTQEGHAPCTAEYPEIPDPSERFAAHGTSCAGLVAAHAGSRENGNGEVIMSAARRNPNAIGYSGVCPKARIMPITTVYNTEYWPMISALLWAVVKGADVILIPRGLSEMPDPDCPEDPFDLRDSRLVTGPARFAEKQLFEAFLTAVADVIPVVVAAGNQGTGLLDYPARLGVPRDGPDPAAKLFIAGAVTARGRRASYSAGHGEAAHAERVFYCPSDDGEDINRDVFRYDSLSWRGRNLDMDRIVKTCEGQESDFSPYGVMAIDIPGQYGYGSDPGPLNDFDEEFAKKNDLESGEGQGKYYEENMPRALYCTFGGTSAAASILAGMIALHLLAKRPDRWPEVDTIREALVHARKPAENLESHHPPEEGISIVRADELLLA